MTAPLVAARQAEAWPVWRCPACDHPNDNLRHTCRPCGAHRPCEHVDGTGRCGDVPVRMYVDGPKCGRHGPVQPDTSRLAAGPDPTALGRTYTVGQWAGSVVAAWERTPRDLYDRHGRATPNPDREKTRAKVRSALVTLAWRLEVDPDRLGPCLNCPAWTLRYGDRGNPLCERCRTAAAAGSACP